MKLSTLTALSASLTTALSTEIPQTVAAKHVAMPETLKQLDFDHLATEEKFAEMISNLFEKFEQERAPASPVDIDCLEICRVPAPETETDRLRQEVDQLKRHIADLCKPADIDIDPIQALEEENDALAASVRNIQLSLTASAPAQDIFSATLEYDIPGSEQVVDFGTPAIEVLSATLEYDIPGSRRVIHFKPAVPYGSSREKLDEALRDVEAPLPKSAEANMNLSHKTLNGVTEARKLGDRLAARAYRAAAAVVCWMDGRCCGDGPCCRKN